jgi:hypothetical protein
MSQDIDHAGTYFAHCDANMPEPNFIAINPENGHGHCAALRGNAGRPARCGKNRTFTFLRRG